MISLAVNALLPAPVRKFPVLVGREVATHAAVGSTIGKILTARMRSRRVVPSEVAVNAAPGTAIGKVM